MSLTRTKSTIVRVLFLGVLWRSSWDGDILGVAPEALQVVIFPSLFREHMNNEVAIVGQHPFSVLESFHAGGELLAFGELLADFLADGLDLPGIRPGADYEEISERGNLAQVENAYIVGLLGFGCADRGEPGGLLRVVCQ